METSFGVETRKSMGNLHLVLKGDFDCNLALTLTTILRREHASCRRFFINTEKLSRVDMLGKAILHSFTKGFADLGTRIYFKGKNGSAMAMEGQKVLLPREQPKPGCGGKCQAGKGKCCQGKKGQEKACCKTERCMGL